MKHLITGGSGFLGVALSRSLIEAGHEVKVFDLSRSNALPEKVEFIKGDVRDRDGLRQAATGVEALHHLVGLMPQARATDEVMQAVNVDGTRNALEAAARAGVKRFIFLSSMEVYGFPETSPFTEDHPLRPVGTYGRNKVEAEAMCAEHHKQRGLETVSLRPATLVGPGINEPTFLDLLGLLSHPPPIFPLPGGGRSRFQMTANDDCVSACILASEQPGVAGEAFNLGADDTLSMREQVENLMRLMGKPAPRFITIPAGWARFALLMGYRLGLSKLEPDHIKLMDTDMVMDCAKAKRMLDWRPRQTNVDMILETYEWFRKR